MYFGVYWMEERLVIRRSHAGAWLPIDLVCWISFEHDNNRSILQQDFMRHLWIPNVFVYNLVSFDALECLQKLAGLWIVEDKTLFYNQVRFSDPWSRQY